MDLFVLLGHPVAHSLSPAMQGAAFRALGLDSKYIALDAQDFAAAWAAVRRLEVRGGNVTVPWKEDAARLLDLPSEQALRARAANTFWRRPDGLLVGTQTDGEGFLRAVGEDFGLSAAGLRAAVLGAGGGARAVLHALAEGGAAALYVWNRTPERARALVEDIRRAGYGGELVLLDGGGSDPGSRSRSDAASAAALPPGQRIDVLVNATSLGLRSGDPVPADPQRFPGLRFAVDLVYGPEPTAFLEACARAGARVADGRGMLLHQGACSFELWFGREAPLEVMRSALAGALRRLRSG